MPWGGLFRDECLNIHWFSSLEDARQKIATWRKEYDDFRPHSALGNLLPRQFFLKLATFLVILKIRPS